MGYETHVRGEIQIVPALTAKELREIGIGRPTTDSYLPADHWPLMVTRYKQQQPTDVSIVVEMEEFDNDEGDHVTRARGVALVATWDEPFKAYSLEADLGAIVTLITGLLTKHTFTGHLQCEGEDHNDIWRLNVIDGRAVKHTPEIKWPEESE